MIDQGFKISKIKVDEVEILRNLSIQTFIETFSAQNTESDMQKYLAENLNKEKLTEELTSTNSEFYFISQDNKQIGYLKINIGQSQTELKDPTGLEIERIYVLKEFLGKQVGHILLEKAIAIAKEKNCDHIWLGVWEENLRAIAFYRKHGFVEFDKHVFKLGNDEQIDIMMKLRLN